MTTALRLQLADVLTQGAHAIASARLGQGGYDPATGLVRPPANDLYQPAPELTPSVAVNRTPTHEVSAHVVLPLADDVVEFSEVAVYGADGTCLMHATFPPQILGSNIEAAFTLTFLPEV